jgi:hypothetical protein
MARTKKTACAMGKGNITIFDLNGGVRFATQLTDSLDDLCDATTISRVVVAKTAAVCVEGQFTDTRDQVAIRYKLTAFPFFAKTKIF